MLGYRARFYAQIALVFPRIVARIGVPVSHFGLAIVNGQMALWLDMNAKSFKLRHASVGIWKEKKVKSCVPLLC